MILFAFCSVNRTENLYVTVLKSRLKTDSFNFCQQTGVSEVLTVSEIL